MPLAVPAGGLFSSGITEQHLDCLDSIGPIMLAEIALMLPQIGAIVIVGAFLLLFAALMLGATVFWILMIVECATKESPSGNDKLIWILIIIFAHGIGALLYYLIRRPQRIAELGA
jgi:hypothetical protein